MTIDPGTTAPQNLYKLLVGVIVPRPIAWVSTVSENGVANLAPFSFFTAVSANPPVICFSPMVKPSGMSKDTLRNIRATGEFVVNIVSEEMVEPMNLTSGDYPPDTDEFGIAGLTAVASDVVGPPRVGGSRVQMECRLQQIVEVSAQPLGGSLVLGEVLRFHVDDSIVEDFRVDPELLNAVGRMGGPTYARTKDRFNLERPRV